MVFVSVYKKKTSADQDFIVLLYYHSMTLMRFGLKETINNKEASPRRFYFWSLLRNPPQIRDLTLH